MTISLKDAGILRLATENGQPVKLVSVPLFNTPEPEMIVSFEGISEAEAREALSRFPGGQRFRLSSRKARHG